MGLVAAAFEAEGISTVCVEPYRHIAERLRAPRALLTPWGLGYPLGKPNDAELQHSVIEQMLSMLEDTSVRTPALREFVE